MLNDEQKKILMENANFKCQKCSYYSPLGNGLEINKEHNAVLCSVCNTFTPSEKEDFTIFLQEKLKWQDLESFRKFGANKGSHQPQRRGMLEKSKQGKLMARPAFGYKVLDGNLIRDDENYENVRLIFEEFSAGKSLNQLSQNYRISVNGVKKMLRNFTYIGKIKFAGQIVQGTHTPLISSELFNRVQQKFESKVKKGE